MPNSAKTISIRQLQAAVKTALEGAKKKHPDLKIDLVAASGPVETLPVCIRIPWICGYPVPWPVDFQNLTEFNKTFVATLASNTHISGLAAEGKFEPAISVSGGNVTIGFVCADVLLTA